MKTPLCFLGFLAIALSFESNAQADALSELAGFSVFDKADLAQLAAGDAKAVRGVAMSTPRFLSVQTCWVAPGAPAQQVEAMRRWNPASHSEMKIFIHANGSDFSRLKDAPNNSAVQALVSATQQLSQELQISKEESARFSAGAGSGGSMAGPVATFWTNLLSTRAQAFASGGSAAQASYDHTGQPIKPNEELSGLLRQQDKIRKQFAPLLESSGIGRGAGGKPEQYWELLEVDNKGVLTLGASYSRAGGGGSYQAADVLYYASGGYYAALTLHQMWPVTVEGKPSTLVWRGDLISSAELGGLHGVERLGAESSMMKDVSKAVRLFRRDTAGSR